MDLERLLHLSGVKLTEATETVEEKLINLIKQEIKDSSDEHAIVLKEALRNILK